MLPVLAYYVEIFDKLPSSPCQEGCRDCYRLMIIAAMRHSADILHVAIVDVDYTSVTTWAEPVNQSSRLTHYPSEASIGPCAPRNRLGRLKEHLGMAQAVTEGDSARPSPIAVSNDKIIEPSTSELINF